MKSLTKEENDKLNELLDLQESTNPAIPEEFKKAPIGALIWVAKNYSTFSAYHLATAKHGELFIPDWCFKQTK
jgi:hypothetical protein